MTMIDRGIESKDKARQPVPYYPAGQERGKMRLPIGKAFLKILLNKAKVYVNVKGCFIEAYRVSGGEPEMYIDLESPRPEYRVHKETELHFGIRANWRMEEIRESNVKSNRIDLYMPLNEVPNLIFQLRCLFYQGKGEINK